MMLHYEPSTVPVAFDFGISAWCFKAKGGRGSQHDLLRTGSSEVQAGSFCKSVTVLGLTFFGFVIVYIPICSYGWRMLARVSSQLDITRSNVEWMTSVMQF